MNIQKINISENQKLISIEDALLNSVIEEINIYNQAYLQLDRPMILASMIHEKTQYELPIGFKLDGDLSGNIICLLDTYNKDIKKEDQALFKSLYIESMNILLGQMITKLDDNFSLSAIISNPSVPTEENIQTAFDKSYSSESYSMGYKLISNSVEYDCRIIINLNKKRTFEV